MTANEEQMEILTNWNSVADPAPASAFLSAPAGMRNINSDSSYDLIYLLQNKGRQVTQPNLTGKSTSVNEPHEVQVDHTQAWAAPSEILLPPSTAPILDGC